MKGHMIESAMWVTGEESAKLIEHHKQQVSLAISARCAKEGWIPGPIHFVTKHPEEDRVPEVPEHISGQRVRLLVAECVVVDDIPKDAKGSFCANLEKQDLERLRRITRRNVPYKLSDDQCDAIIEKLGPDTAFDLVMADSKRDKPH